MLIPGRAHACLSLCVLCVCGMSLHAVIVTHSTAAPTIGVIVSCIDVGGAGGLHACDARWCMQRHGRAVRAAHLACGALASQPAAVELTVMDTLGLGCSRSYKQTQAARLAAPLCSRIGFTRIPSMRPQHDCPRTPHHRTTGLPSSTAQSSPPRNTTAGGGGGLATSPAAHRSYQLPCSSASLLLLTAGPLSLPAKPLSGGGMGGT